MPSDVAKIFKRISENFNINNGEEGSLKVLPIIF